MSDRRLDNALYFNQEKEKLIGLIGQYFDDSFQTGKNEFLNENG